MVAEIQFQRFRALSYSSARNFGDSTLEKNNMVTMQSRIFNDRTQSANNWEELER